LPAFISNAASSRFPLPRPQALLAAALQPTPGLAAGAAANSLVYLAGIKVLLRGLTWEGVVSSWFLGTLAYAAFGAGGYGLVCLYFVVGSLVTKLKLEQKQREGIAEARSGRRGLVSSALEVPPLAEGNSWAWGLLHGFLLSLVCRASDGARGRGAARCSAPPTHFLASSPTCPPPPPLPLRPTSFLILSSALRLFMQGSVLGSGLAGAACAAAALATGDVALWRVGFVASFASKLADTVSSEVGKVRQFRWGASARVFFFSRESRALHAAAAGAGRRAGGPVGGGNKPAWVGCPSRSLGR
jgi:hypothetical protein